MDLKDKFSEKQTQYMDARIAGNSPVESKKMAQYAPTLSVSRIETPGMHKEIIKALDKQGLTDKWLAREIKKGATTAWGKGTVVGTNKETGEPIYAPNFAAHSRYLDKVSDMRGYGKPSVAVQVNTNTQINASAELGLDQLDSRAVESLIGAVRDAISKTESTDIHEAEVVPDDVPAHPGVVQTPPQV